MSFRRMRVVGFGIVALTLSGRAFGFQNTADVPTFSRDIAPIFYRSCVECHRAGEIAPMSLVTYDEARPWARSIREEVLLRAMPPWHAEGPTGEFVNDRRLRESERSTIVAWVDGGAPEGNRGELPAVPRFAEGWTIGPPDAVLSMPVEFAVPATGQIDYQYFQVETGFAEDKWIQAVEIRPGERRVVHHVLVYSRAPDGERPPPAFRPANPPPEISGRERLARLVERSGGRGRSAAGSNPLPADMGELIATTAPGTNALVFPEGRAMLVEAGSVLTFQMHYTSNGEATTDQSRVGFVFGDSPPEEEVFSRAFLNAGFVIPAGASNHRVDSAIEFVRDANIVAIFPHTHLRGQSWEYRMVYPDGRSEVILSLPNYDFNWQTYYEFSEPIAAPRGARLEGTAYYDNSAANRDNPDASVEVFWGEQTWDEMQYTGVTFVTDDSDAER